MYIKILLLYLPIILFRNPSTSTVTLLVSAVTRKQYSITPIIASSGCVATVSSVPIPLKTPRKRSQSSPYVMFALHCFMTLGGWFRNVHVILLSLASKCTLTRLLMPSARILCMMCTPNNTIVSLPFLVHIPLVTGVDGGLLPRILLATTLTSIVVEGGHDEDRRISKL